jgi:hypothetical protein
MKGYDNWERKKADVLRLYLMGKEPRLIAGLTGVPRIRIEHEMNKANEMNPDLLQRHLAAQYPKRRSRMRFISAVILIDKRERYRAVNEY